MNPVKSVGMYALMHFLVDFICAATMFYRFIPMENSLFYILLYNFCAFAFQMPLGVVMDRMCEGGRHRHTSDSMKNRDNGRCQAAVFADFGCKLIGAGWILSVYFKIAESSADAAVLNGGFVSVIHTIFFAGIVVILGLGNAMFHVGGGVGTMYLCGPNLRLPALGIFVAPGAIGLFLGGVAGKGAVMQWVSVLALMILLVFSKLEVLRERSFPASAETIPESRWPVSSETLPKRRHPGADLKFNGRSGLPNRVTALIMTIVCCFLVVVLRSFAGLAITFPWKTTTVLGLISVAAVAGGKAAGGLAASRFGIRRTVVLSLILAALFYALSGYALSGDIGLVFL